MIGPEIMNLTKIAEKRTLAVHRVEAFGLPLRQMVHARRTIFRPACSNLE